MSYNEEFDFEKWKKEHNYEVGGGYEDALEKYGLTTQEITTKKLEKSKTLQNFKSGIFVFGIISNFRQKIIKITNEEKKVNEIFKNVNNLEKIQKLFQDKEKLKKEIGKIRDNTQSIISKKYIDPINLNLDSVIQNFDKLCLAVGCKHSFTGIKYN